MTTSAQTKAAALEGLDFIETEEDVKAVEAATLKIQSTFRGKKIRSKLTPASGGGGGDGKGEDEASAAAKKTVASSKQESSKTIASSNKHKTKTTTATATPPPPPPTTTTTTTATTTKQNSSETELSKRVGEMQVNDNTNEAATQPQAGLPEEEAERAATKIQAGFKGYKTRKELEGKLTTSGSGGTAQQAAPSDCADK